MKAVLKKLAPLLLFAASSVYAHERGVGSSVELEDGFPSTTDTLVAKRKFRQTLVVRNTEKFKPVKVGIYQKLMQSYTKDFGFSIWEPQIISTCEVIKQDLAWGRGKHGFAQSFSHWLLDQSSSGGERGIKLPGAHPNLRTSTKSGNLLVLTFTMQYESRFGYDVDDYPLQFKTHVNNNLEKVTQQLIKSFLPVIEAKQVVVYNEDRNS